VDLAGRDFAVSGVISSRKNNEKQVFEPKFMDLGMSKKVVYPKIAMFMKMMIKQWMEWGTRVSEKT
jgi:hypothetical protein